MQNPSRTGVAELNEQLTCRLCKGYLIDATTVIECLHSFCRSCILKHLEKLKNERSCPTCSVPIYKANLQLRQDQTLQDIVYKLVPGLFQSEMTRRRAFFDALPMTNKHPKNACLTDQRIIYSPDQMISVCLELSNPLPPSTRTMVCDEDASEPNGDLVKLPETAANRPKAKKPFRRFLNCPAAVTVAHLKKLITSKFDLGKKYNVDLYYTCPLRKSLASKMLSSVALTPAQPILSDTFNLMDIAYIYTWKRKGPLRLYYQITDPDYSETPPTTPVPPQHSSKTEKRSERTACSTPPPAKVFKPDVKITNCDSPNLPRPEPVTSTLKEPTPPPAEVPKTPANEENTISALTAELVGNCLTLPLKKHEISCQEVTSSSPAVKSLKSVRITSFRPKKQTISSLISKLNAEKLKEVGTLGDDRNAEKGAEVKAEHACLISRKDSAELSEITGFTEHFLTDKTDSCSEKEDRVSNYFSADSQDCFSPEMD